MPTGSPGYSFPEGRVANILERREFDYAGITLYDPLNIRYATDSINMQLWITHNASCYVFVATDGQVLLFDYEGCEMLSNHSRYSYEAELLGG